MSGSDAEIRLVIRESGPVPIELIARTLKLYADPVVSTEAGV